MKLSALIKQLEEYYEDHGDVEVFTNGEHGFEDTEELCSDMVSIGEAQAELPEADKRYGVEDDTIVVHIGGY